MSTETRPAKDAENTEDGEDVRQEMLAMARQRKFLSGLLKMGVSEEGCVLALPPAPDRLSAVEEALANAERRYRWLCQHLSSDWMIGEDVVTDFADLDQWEKEGGEDDCPEIRKAWDRLIDLASSAAHTAPPPAPTASSWDRLIDSASSASSAGQVPQS